MRCSLQTLTQRRPSSAVTASAVSGIRLPFSAASSHNAIGLDILASVRLKLVGMTVWVEFWQMQCCGKPFRLGDRVAWTVRATDPDWLEIMLGPVTQPGVDAVEDHHGGVPEGTAPTRGIVTRIAAVHCRYAPRPGSDSYTSYPVPGSGVLTFLESADGWTADRGAERFAGYLVKLKF